MLLVGTQWSGRLTPAVAHVRTWIRSTPRSAFAVPEAPLPQATKRALAGAVGAVGLAYAGTTEPEILISAGAVTLAVVAAIVSIAARQARATCAGVVLGGVLIVPLLVVSSASRALSMLELFLPQLWMAILLGTLAGSSVREQIGWVHRFVTRAGTVVLYAAGTFGIIALVTLPDHELAAAGAAIAKDAGGLRFALFVAGIGTLVVMAFGVAVGRTLRRALAPAPPDTEHDAYSRWAALYGR